jgi:hypothetical protein
MSKRQNQSISGTIQNLTDEGFDLESSFKEITDNSIGAGATQIRFFLDPINLTLYVIDNGIGMNKSGLTKLATLNDRKEVSEAKQGKYGQGVKLAFAYLSQLKGAITIISKSENYDASKEDAINQIIIDFPGGIESDNYNPTGETACTPNKNLWERFADTIGNPNTGTLIKIQMDKRICKELYKKIVTDSVQESIIANMGLINYQFLSDSNNSIIVSTYEVVKNNEPEITLQSEYDNITEEDDAKESGEDETSGENISNKQVQLNIEENNENFWDAECSEDFDDYDVLSFYPIGNLDSDKVQKYKCAILQNSVKDINTIIFWKGAWHIITEQNVVNLSTKPTNLGSDINEAAKILKSVVKSEFYINLAHSDNWIETHKDIISYIMDCDVTELPQPSNKDPLYGKLLSFIKGNYYSRNGTIALNSRQKARAHSGGDRAKNVFEDNIITLVEYPAKADREFGVTVKKYSTIEEIVHSSIRNVIYFLKKRWATDYNNELKRLEKEKLAKIVAEKQAAEAKKLAEVKKLAEEEAKRQADIQAKILGESAEKRKAEAEEQRLAVIKAQKEAEEESKRLSEIEANRKSEIDDMTSDTSEQSQYEDNSDDEEEIIEQKKDTKLKPQKTPRSSNIATYLNKKDLLKALENWQKSNLYQEELDETINYMCSEYKLYTESVIEDVLRILNLKQKINHLRMEIINRYKNDSDRVSCGTDFIKAYQTYFK